MRTILIKAVILTDGENYVIHGANSETPEEMFKTANPLWNFDPSTEMAHYVELPVTLPELETLPKQLADEVTA